MKIVQSLWSKPGRIRKKADYASFNKCGWPDRKYFYYSWALSCLQFRKYYEEVELVTDKEGYELLIDKMQLPYTNVRVVLDDLKDYHPDLWALGKIYAYQIQEKPFIHADADIIIWDKFSQDFEDSSLLCQSKEEGDSFNRYYSSIFRPIVKCFSFYPGVLDRSIALNKAIKAVSMGIVGGHHLDFFAAYTRMAFEMVDRNVAHLPRIDIAGFNLIFEQFLFCALVEEKKESMNFYYLPDDYIFNDLADYTSIPEKNSYFHPAGSDVKHLAGVVNVVEHYLLKDYPHYYFSINHLLRSHQI